MPCCVGIGVFLNALLCWYRCVLNALLCWYRCVFERLVVLV